jgi:hypothetical protein
MRETIMSKTLLAFAAATSITAGVVTGATMGNAIVNAFFNVSIRTVRAIRRLRRRLQ